MARPKNRKAGARVRVFPRWDRKNSPNMAEKRRSKGEKIAGKLFIKI
jgi:hypothetical protein